MEAPAVPAPVVEIAETMEAPVVPVPVVAVPGAAPSFKGVRWDVGVAKWAAQIWQGGVTAHLGYFDCAEEAACRYDEAAAPLGVPLNFPKVGAAACDSKADVAAGSMAATAMKGSSSRFRGVGWYKAAKKWVAGINNNGEHIHLGYFDDEETAARKYDEAAAILGRPLNFPKPPGEEAVAPGGDLSSVKGGRKTSSRFKGVGWNKGNQKWVAQIFKEGKSSHLGYYDDEVEAARMYDKAAAALGRRLNFPPVADGSDVGPVMGSKGRTSRFKGVCWYKAKQKWLAQYMKGGKTTTLGYFDNEEDAARKYDEVAVTLGRRRNFLADGTEASAATESCGGWSRFKGVSWHKASNKWHAQIQKEGKRKYLGYYNDEEEAARKYDDAAGALGWPLNFPKVLGDPSAVKGSSGSLSHDEGGGLSRFKGVSWSKRDKKWKAAIKRRGKTFFLGYFEDEEEAARKYDEALGRPLNFDQSTSDEGQAAAETADDPHPAAAIAAAIDAPPPATGVPLPLPPPPPHAVTIEVEVPADAQVAPPSNSQYSNKRQKVASC